MEIFSPQNVKKFIIYELINHDFNTKEMDFIKRMQYTNKKDFISPFYRKIANQTLDKYLETCQQAIDLIESNKDHLTICEICDYNSFSSLCAQAHHLYNSSELSKKVTNKNFEKDTKRQSLNCPFHIQFTSIHESCNSFRKNFCDAYNATLKSIRKMLNAKTPVVYAIQTIKTALYFNDINGAYKYANFWNSGQTLKEIKNSTELKRLKYFIELEIIQNEIKLNHNTQIYKKNILKTLFEGYWNKNSHSLSLSEMMKSQESVFSQNNKFVQDRNDNDSEATTKASDICDNQKISDKSEETAKSIIDSINFDVRNEIAERTRKIDNLLKNFRQSESFNKLKREDIFSEALIEKYKKNVKIKKSKMKIHTKKLKNKAGASAEAANDNNTIPSPPTQTSHEATNKKDQEILVNDQLNASPGDKIVDMPVVEENKLSVVEKNIKNETSCGSDDLCDEFEYSPKELKSKMKSEKQINEKENNINLNNMSEAQHAYTENCTVEANKENIEHESESLSNTTESGAENKDEISSVEVQKSNLQHYQNLQSFIDLVYKGEAKLPKSYVFKCDNELPIHFIKNAMLLLKEEWCINLFHIIVDISKYSCKNNSCKHALACLNIIENLFIQNGILQTKYLMEEVCGEDIEVISNIFRKNSSIEKVLAFKMADTKQILYYYHKYDFDLSFLIDVAEKEYISDVYNYLEMIGKTTDVMKIVKYRRLLGGDDIIVDFNNKKSDLSENIWYL